MDQTTSQEQRRVFLRSVRDALTVLLRDLELQEGGFQYFYVVDFAAIYAWVYKTFDHPFIRIPGESDERIFARRHMALQTLFSGRQPLILIPPYATELKNHIDSLSTRGKLAVVDAGLYRDKLSRLISQSDLFKEFVQLRSRESELAANEARGDHDGGGSSDSTPKDPLTLTQAAIEIGKEYFPELYSVLEFSAAKGGDTIRTLFRDRILLDADAVLLECHDIDYSGPATDKWYQQINTMRDGVRALQSLTDAMACAYVELANQRLNRDRKIVVFVSPSNTVETALAHSTLISPTPEVALDAVRDLTYCLLSFIHENSITAVTESLNTVTRLLEVYESPIPVDWRVRERREEAAREWKRCENMLLMKDSVSIEQSPAKGKSNWDSAFGEILEQLLATFAQDKDRVELEVRKKLSDLYQETVELNKLIPASRTFDTFRAIMVTKTGVRGVHLTFPGLQDELPLSISFTNRGVVRLAGRFKELHQNYSENGVMVLRILILNEAEKPDATPEHHLLAGYILALERRYDTALAELEAGLKNASDSERAELMFLSAAIHRKLYHAKEACEVLESALRAEPNDARLHVEYAKALWLKWRESDNRASAQYLETALQHLQIASSSKAALNLELRAQIENVAAYIHTERLLSGAASQTAIEEAEQHIRRLEELLPESKWIGRFFDTRSHVYYAKAQSLAPDQQKEKEGLLEHAARDSAKSLEFEDVGLDPEVRRQHHHAIIQARTAGARTL